MVANAQLRYPGEWFDLVLAGILASIIFILLSILTGGLCCLWGFVGIIVVLIMVGAANNHMKVISSSIDEESHPDIYRACERSAKKLGINMPVIFIDSSPKVNAYTSGILTPIIVLHQGLVDIMDDKELRFVIGHEMGHIKLYHFTIKTILDSSTIRVPLIAYIPLLLFKLLFLNGRMSRSMEHSADRAGIHACGDIRKAVSCIIKLKTGESNVKKKLVSMAISGELDLDDDGFIQEILSTHPEFEDRVKEMVEYSRNTGVGWKDLS